MLRSFRFGLFVLALSIGAISPTRPALAQSPCSTSGAFPVRNRMSEADRSTFIYNLPSKLLTEEETVRARARDLGESSDVTCLRVDGTLIEQDFWSRKRFYISDGTRTYTLWLAGEDGRVNEDMDLMRDVIACRIPKGRITVSGEFDGIAPVALVHPYARHWGNASLPAAVIENGPMTVVVRNVTFHRLEHPNGGSMMSSADFQRWHNSHTTGADSLELANCGDHLATYRHQVSVLLKNATAPQSVLQHMNDSIKSPYAGAEARYVQQQISAQARQDSATRGDTACTVTGFKRRLAQMRHQCR